MEENGVDPETSSCGYIASVNCNDLGQRHCTRST